jgi:hypothetical protein
MTYSQRTFGGQADLTGQRIGSLVVESVIHVHPILSYWARCSHCNTSASYSHRELLQGGGKCKQPQHALEVERQDIERQDIARRRAARDPRSW